MDLVKLKVFSYQPFVMTILYSFLNQKDFIEQQVCMCMCGCVCLCVDALGCMCMCGCIGVYVYVWMHWGGCVCVCVDALGWMCMCGCIGVYVWMHWGGCVYVYVWMCMCGLQKFHVMFFVIVEQVPDSDYTIPLSQAEVITEG